MFFVPNLVFSDYSLEKKRSYWGKRTALLWFAKQMEIQGVSIPANLTFVTSTNLKSSS